jgi:hypothetical protein
MKTKHRFTVFAVCFAAILTAFALAGCDQPTTPDDPFVPVTGITGVPDSLEKNTELDLTKAAVTPAAATHKTIVWSVKDAGGTGVTNEDLTDGKVTPATAGDLVLTAKVTNGRAGGDYTEEFTITITQFVAATGIQNAPADRGLV